MTPLSQPSATMTFTPIAGAAYTQPTAGAWEDWDISAVVPSTAKYVEILCEKLGAAGLQGVRENGNGDNRRFQAAAGGTFILTVPIGSAGILETSSWEANKSKFYVTGYWE